MTPSTERPILTRLAFTLLCLFVFTIPLSYATEIPMIGKLSQAAGLAATVVGAIAVLARRHIRLLGGVHMAMAGFILWSAVTLCWSVAPEMTTQRIMTYLQLFVLVLLLWEMCMEERDVLGVLSAFVLGTIAPALLTLNGFIPGQQAMFQRQAIAGYDPNQLAFLLALSLPVSYYLILRGTGAMSAVYRLQMGIAVCAVLFTGSAGCMVAMAIGLSLVCWTFHTISTRTRANAFAMVMLLAGAAVLFLPSNVLKGIVEDTRKGDVTFTTMVNRGMDTVRTTPIGGFGAGSQTPAPGTVSLSGRPASLTIYAETGAVGVACFFAVVAVLFLAAERMRGIHKSFWLTLLGVWAAGAISLSWDCSQPAWMLFGLLAAHSACASPRTVKSSEKSASVPYRFEDQAEVWS